MTAADRIVRHVDHVVTGTPTCGAALGLSGVATTTVDQVTCRDCRHALPAPDACTSCALSRDHRDVAHRPTRHAVWCLWASCGHPITRGNTACTKEHPQEGTPVSEPTEDKPPTKKAARKPAAPPPPTYLPGKYSPQQEVRFVSLGDAAQLLSELGEFSAADLLTVARWIVGGDHVDDPDDGGPGLTFVGGPTTTSTTNTEGATQ